MAKRRISQHLLLCLEACPCTPWTLASTRESHVLCLQYDTGYVATRLRNSTPNSTNLIQWLAKVLDESCWQVVLRSKSTICIVAGIAANTMMLHCALCTTPKACSDYSPPAEEAEARDIGRDATEARDIGRGTSKAVGLATPVSLGAGANPKLAGKLLMSATEREPAPASKSGAS